MKLIRTVDAAGQVLCHDITQIIPGEFKGPRFRKGHIVQPEDIPVLLSIGKENLYVWEKRPGILHEDEAAALLYKAAAGKNIHGTEPKEGKIELIADCDGLLKIDRAALLAVNRTPQMMIATIHGDMPVKKGQKLAGTRIIPLVIEQEKMDAMAMVPLVGSIACGTPITAEQNIEQYIGVPAAWHADFALTCHGDSMAPTICDGDIVCIRCQPEVEQGEIAAVRIGEEATLKHFHRQGDTVMLLADNAAVCPPMVYTGPQLNEIRIEGRAVGFCRGL